MTLSFLSILDVYHLVFAPPKTEEVADRLVEEPGGIQKNVHDLLELYHRNNSALLSCYTNLAKNFNADQPIEDLFDQGESSITGSWINCQVQSSFLAGSWCLQAMHT